MIFKLTCNLYKPTHKAQQTNIKIYSSSCYMDKFTFEYIHNHHKINLWKVIWNNYVINEVVAPLSSVYTTTMKDGISQKLYFILVQETCMNEEICMHMPNLLIQVLHSINDHGFFRAISKAQIWYHICVSFKHFIYKVVVILFVFRNLKYRCSDQSTSGDKIKVNNLIYCLILLFLFYLFRTHH